MDSAQDAEDRLEAVFIEIHQTRMKEVPILNPALRVEAVGFRAWNRCWFGILVTPWCINLMLLPDGEARAEAWGKIELGQSQCHVFPAGRFDFIVGEETALGRFQMCSLFSPVLEFEDQEAAIIAGKAALEAILEQQGETTENPDRHMLRLARGKFPSAKEIAEGRAPAARKTVSRRALLTGSSSNEERLDG